MRQKRFLRVQKRCIYKRKIQHANFLLQKGVIGFVSLESHSITRRQLECCRLLLRRELKKKGIVLLRAQLTVPITKKSTGVRMGKGKGGIEKYIGFLSVFDCFLELKGVSLPLGLKLMKKVSYKLPFHIGLITNKGTLYTL